MTELQIQQDLDGKTKGQTQFKIPGKERKPKPFPQEKKGGLDKYV